MSFESRVRTETGKHYFVQSPCANRMKCHASKAPYSIAILKWKKKKRKEKKRVFFINVKQKAQQQHVRLLPENPAKNVGFLQGRRRCIDSTPETNANDIFASSSGREACSCRERTRNQSLPLSEKWGSMGCPTNGATFMFTPLTLKFWVGLSWAGR